MATLESVESFRGRLEGRALAPLTGTGKGFYLLAGLLLLVIAWGLYAYSVQLREGLWATGMRDRISWGLYIALFVFFIGVSMSGTMVSAVLRITGAGWRTPITRVAEVVTVAALMVAGLFILFDMGRPDRLFNVLVYGRWRSPITWDVYGITLYIIGSLTYLYLALIPDLARCRDKLGRRAGRPRTWLYETLSVGWRGTERQRRRLGIGLGIMMIVIIPVAVSMHTVTSLLFASTHREAWDNPMFPGFFVAGALYSGTGVIITLIAIVRKTLHLEEYLTAKHFRYLGYVLVTTALMVVFFNLSEYTVKGYKMTEGSALHFQQLLSGAMAPVYWAYIVVGIIIPILLVIVPATRNITGIVTAAVMAVVGMALERYVIVVGGLRIPLQPYEPASYSPSWVEWSVSAGGLALFSLIIMLALKVFPAVAIEETVEEYGRQAR